MSDVTEIDRADLIGYPCINCNGEGQIEIAGLNREVVKATCAECGGDGLHPPLVMRVSTGKRESLGELVRRIWVKWAKQQPNPKSTWLTPWKDLSESDKEVDRRIGQILYDAGCEKLRADLDAEKESRRVVAENYATLRKNYEDTLADLADANERERKMLEIPDDAQGEPLEDFSVITDYTPEDAYNKGHAVGWNRRMTKVRAILTNTRKASTEKEPKL